MPYQDVVGVADTDKSTASWMSPMKMFEYMSAKKPIISSELPVLKEILNKNAVLVRHNNVNDWVNAIKYLSVEKNRNLILSNAYNDFLKKHTWDIRAKNILKNLF